MNTSRRKIRYSHNAAEIRAKLKPFIPELTLGGALFLTAIGTGQIIYQDTFVDGSTYSNRSLIAIPAASISGSITLNGAYRLRFIPLWLRITLAPFVFFSGYVGIALTLLILGMVFYSMIRWG